MIPISPFLRIMIAILCLMLLTASDVKAQEFSLSDYIQVSVERLQLVKNALERENRPPSALEEKQLFEQYHLTPEAYYSYRGTHLGEVDGYLATHPEKQELIDSLRTQIEQLIARGEKP
jgi:hypothetical protein